MENKLSRGMIKIWKFLRILTQRKIFYCKLLAELPSMQGDITEERHIFRTADCHVTHGLRWWQLASRQNIDVWGQKNVFWVGVGWLYSPIQCCSCVFCINCVFCPNGQLQYTATRTQNKLEAKMYIFLYNIFVVYFWS